MTLKEWLMLNKRPVPAAPPPAFTVRYYGADDGLPRHDWCRGTSCISCGCIRAQACSSHSEARGYRDWVKERGLCL